MEILYLIPAIAASAVAAVMAREEWRRLAVILAFVVPCLVSFSASAPFTLLSAGFLAVDAACLIVAQKDLACGVVLLTLWFMPGGAP